MAQIDSKKTLYNIIWRFGERCGAQIVAFAVSVVLARMLAPEAYGTVALLMVFIKILQVFVDSGLGNALIQKKDADELDFSTVFYVNLVFCGICYIFLFLCTPLIAEFYDDVSLIPLIRVLGITIVVSGVKNIQQAYVFRNLMFKKFFFSALGGTIAAAAIGIAMALSGYGVWALAAQEIVNVTVDMIVLWITVRWRPQKRFSIKRLKRLFSYGWKLLISSLMDISYNNIRQLIIGKLYSSTDLAYYNRGRQFPDFIVGNINNAIDSVLFPAMASIQDNRQDVKQMMRKSIKVSVYIMAPLMMGLTFTADSVVKVVLTEKWLESVPYLRVFCISFMFFPIHTANLNALKAMGRSDLFLKLEILKKCIGIVLLFSSMWFGTMAMAYSMLLSSFLCQIINSWPNKKLLGYGYLKQMRDILPYIFLSGGMGILVWFVSLTGLPTLLVLILQMALGMAVYILGSMVFRIDSFIYMKGVFKSVFTKGKPDR